MTGNELYELYKKGTKITVRFTALIEELPLQFEEGMFAVIENVILNDEEVLITVNEKDFNNKNLEKACFKNGDTEEFKRYSELFQRKETVSFYDDANHELANIEIISNLELVEEYIKSNEKISYVQWLENLVMQMRKE